jgi:hypothetical protein
MQESRPLLFAPGTTERCNFDKEASQTRDYWVAKNATLRAARPDPSLRKERLLDCITTLAGSQRVDWLRQNRPRLTERSQRQC